MIKTQNTKETSEAIVERLKKSKLNIGDVIIPLVVIIVLVLLSIFVFIPMVSSAIEFRRESKEINAKMETLADLEEGLNSIDETTLEEDLIVAKKVIPSTLKVSDFISYIDTLATGKNLTERELTASDVKVVTGGDSDNPDYTYAVNGPLGYAGSLESILEFLNELQTTSPYVISIEDISLREGSGDLWNVSFTITGYYMPDSTESVDLYYPFSAYTKYGDIIEIFREKAEKLSD